jgi:SAM-dependent methyltransferase
MTDQPNATAETADFEFTALNEANNYRAALLRDFQAELRGSVLEVGAGIGHITTGLIQLPCVNRLFSIEPDPRFFDQLRRRFPRHELLQGTVADLPPGTSWDAILSINVLEHIAADEQELSAYHGLLKPAQGSLCLFVPARPEIYAPIDKDFGHFRRYTRRELRRKLEQAGFQVRQLRYYNFVGYFAWWLNFCVLRQRSFNVGSVRFFDRLVFPAVHAGESKLCAPPFGQSLMAVAVAR